MEKNIIKAETLTKIYKRGSEKVYAVNQVSVEVKKGEFVAIMGPSGSGKTTLLDLVGCLDSISGGKLEVFGRDVSRVRRSSSLPLGGAT